MNLDQNLNLDSYFKFLKEYFATFDFSVFKIRKVTGENFKL